MTTPVRTLALWCPDWPVTAAGFDSSADRVVVLHANRVVACSAAARVDGVRRGLRRREAQARSPEAVVLAADLDGEARAFEPIAAAVSELAPKLEIMRPGLCAVPTRGPSRYFGGDMALIERVVAAVDSVVPAARPRAGIADGVFAAQLAARTGTVVERGGSRLFLAPFPVTTLDRPELSDLLARLGVHTLGDFAALEPTDVVGRFGSDGVVAHRLARGLDERPINARVPAPDFAVEVVIDPPAERVDAAAFVARGLAEALTARLSSDGLACTRVAIEAESEHGESFSRVWRSDSLLRAGAIVERVRWQLDGWLNAPWGQRPTAGLTLLRLVPEEVKRDEGRQMGFWGGASQADERAERALARVQGILGLDAVVTAVVSGGRSPAERVRFVPWGDARSPNSDPSLPWPGRVPSPSPSVVHPKPIAADLLDERGRTVVVSGRCMPSAAPVALAVGSAAPVALRGWAGPWPLEERWWDPEASSRRARFQVVTTEGDAFLLSTCNGTWAVEATY